MEFIILLPKGEDTKKFIFFFLILLYYKEEFFVTRKRKKRDSYGIVHISCGFVALKRAVWV